MLWALPPAPPPFSCAGEAAHPQLPLLQVYPFLLSSVPSEVLTADNALLQNERTASQSLGMRLVSSVQLVNALGGGWAQRAVP